MALWALFSTLPAATVWNRALGFSPWAVRAVAPFTLTGVSVRRRQLPPFSEWITAWLKRPFFHVRSTVKPPRALMPVMLPSGHTEGRAGKSWIKPAWLCISISMTPAV